MRKIWISLFLALLLCGCAAQAPQPATTEPTPVSTAAPEPTAFQEETGMELLSQENGIVGYGFSGDIAGVLPLRDNLLLFSAAEPTVLTLVDPGSLQILSVHEPGIVLTTQNSTVQLLDRGISYYNGTTGETIVLDDRLREIRRVQAPESLSGMPMLSGDGNTLYYCTPSAVRALDLTTGISRVLKEAAYPVQSLSGLLLEDRVLQISITDTDGQWRTLFLSSEDGRLLKESDGNLLPETGAEHYLLQSGSSIFHGLPGSICRGCLFPGT